MNCYKIEHLLTIYDKNQSSGKLPILDLEICYAFVQAETVIKAIDVLRDFYEATARVTVRDVICIEKDVTSLCTKVRGREIFPDNL